MMWRLRRSYQSRPISLSDAMYDTLTLKLRTILLGCCLLFAFSVIGQDAEQEILLNEPLTVQISPEQPIRLRYTNQDAGARIGISARSVSDDVDPVFWVVDADMQVLAYADKDTSGSDERVDALLLPQESSYMIYVDSFNGVTTGEVELLVQPASPGITIEETADLILIEGTLPEDRLVTLFGLNLSAGSSVTVTIRDTSGTIDPYVQIRDSEGVIVVANDDHNSVDTRLNVFDAQIRAWNAPESGLYTVAVLDILGRAGNFIAEIEVID